MPTHDLLTGRTGIVTGAATGIGQAFAIGAAAHGANVVVADMNLARHIAPDFVRHDPGLPFEVSGPYGVLVEHWAQLDNLGMMKQLGAVH